MKIIWGIGTIVYVGVVGWRIGGSLSTDALGMAIGMLFGIMAGIPTALILLASQRRETDVQQQRQHAPQRLLEQNQPPAPQITNVYHQHLHIHGTPDQVRSRLTEIQERNQ